LRDGVWRVVSASTLVCAWCVGVGSVCIERKDKGELRRLLSDDTRHGDGDPRTRTRTRTRTRGAEQADRGGDGAENAPRETAEAAGRADGWAPGSAVDPAWVARAPASDFASAAAAEARAAGRRVLSSASTSEVCLPHCLPNPNHPHPIIRALRPPPPVPHPRASRYPDQAGALQEEAGEAESGTSANAGRERADRTVDAWLFLAELDAGNKPKGDAEGPGRR
jgi:hypothetical protein